jgi:hypothetical protein
VHRPADHRSRARRWTDHVAGLVQAQAEYAAWLRIPVIVIRQSGRS